MPTPCSGEIDRRQAQVDAKIEAIAGSGRFAPGSRGALLHRAPADAGLAQGEFFPTDCSFDHLVDAHEEQGRNCVLWPRAWASSHAWRSRRFLTTDKANYWSPASASRARGTPGSEKNNYRYWGDGSATGLIRARQAASPPARRANSSGSNRRPFGCSLVSR